MYIAKMKPGSLNFLCLIGILILLVTSLGCSKPSTTIFVGYQNGSRVETDCYDERMGTVYCPSLEDAKAYIVTRVSSTLPVEIKIWKLCYRSFTLDTCETKPIILPTRLQFENLSNIALIGNTEGVTILCEPNNKTGAGLIFKSIHGLIIRNLTIDGCSTIRILHCTNVTLEMMSFKSITGRGLLFWQTDGIVRIVNSKFKTSGMHIYLTQQNSVVKQSHYTIENCTFMFRKRRRNGGGMALIFNKAYRNVVKITGCLFHQNFAINGGGLYTLMGKSWENIILVVACRFVANTGNGSGGGVYMQYFANNRNNTVAFSDCTFEENMANRGGGVVLAADGNSSSTFAFYRCVWYRNSALYTAAAIELLSYSFFDLVSPKPVPVFENCSFIGNFVRNIPIVISHSTTQWNMARGTFVATRYEVHFMKSIRFENNTGSGIYAISSLITFNSDINAIFINNSGINGGAMALRLSSSLHVNTNSTFIFANNSALLRGAAIYVDFIDDYFSSSECFIHFSESTNNVTIAFLGNFAGVYTKRYGQFGRAVFATLVCSCEKICPKQIFGMVSTYERHNCNANVTLEDHSIKESGQLMVRKQFFMNQGPIRNSIPGKEFDISLEVQDKMQRSVDSVFRAFILDSSNITIDPTYSYMSVKTLKVYGSPGSKGILVLERMGFPEVYLSVNILLQECPPGYIVDEKKGNYSKNTTECSCSWNHKQTYRGILKCNTTLFQASILHGFWAGYDGEPATPDNLFSAFCPHGFCSYNTTEYSVFNPLPRTASRSELEVFMCGAERTGTLCGKCSDNHSVYFHSADFKCNSNRHCELGTLFYVISELLPVTIVFITVMIFNIDFTSGAVNGFIFFAQVLDTLAVGANGIVHLPKGIYLLTQVYQFIYGFFNLEFFGIDSLSFCIWKDATALDVLAIKYVTVAYALVLVVATVMLMNTCSCCFYRIFPCLKPRVVKNSVIHGLSAFLVMCYTQCTIISLRILTPIFIEGLKSSQVVVFYDGNIKYFSKHHVMYAIPALICLSTIVVIPPTLLLLYPAAWRILAVCHINNETKCIGRLLTMIERFKPLLDSFQSCFKDKYRFFAGLYFIYRMSPQLTSGITVSLTQFYTAVEIQLIIMLMLHALVQPYRKQWHNIVDTFLLTDIAAINALTMFIYSHATDGNAHTHTNGATFLQLILIFIPLIYISAYAVVQLMLKLKSVLKGSVENISSGEDNELPARLLDLEMEDSSLDYHALHGQ